MSYLKDREIWLSNVPTDNPPAGYVWVFIQNGVFVVRDSNGLDKIMATTTGTVTNATSASYVEYSNVASKPALISGSSQVSYTGLSNIPVGIVSGSSQVTYSGLTGIPSGIVSGSAQVTYSGLTGVPSGIVSGSAQIASFGIFATTGSNGFNGSQSITGSLTVTGQVVAQTLNVQQVTSSIVYSSGSNIFGNTLGNTQQFTGSVSITGSLNTSIAAFGSAATVFLTSDGGVIKSRTAAQTLSDIAALPLAGGTLTGALNGTSAVFSSTLTSVGATINGANNAIIDLYNTALADTNARNWRIVTNDSAWGSIEFKVSTLYNNAPSSTKLTLASTGAATFSSTVSATQYTATSTGGSGLRVYGAAGTNQWDIYLNSTNLRFSDNTGTGSIVFDRPLNGTSAVFSGASNPIVQITASATFPLFSLVNTPQTAQWNIELGRTVSGNLEFYNSGTKISFTPTGAATFSSTVQAGGNIISRTANYPQIVFEETTSSTNSLIFYDNVATPKQMGFRVNSGTNVMTLTSTNVGIGTATPSAILHTLKSGTPISAVTDEVFIGQRSATGQNAAITVVSDGISIIRLTNAANIELGKIHYDTASNFMRFDTNSAERMRITSGGFLKASNDGTYVNGASSTYHEFKTTLAAINMYMINTNAEGNALLVNLDSNSTSYYFFRGYYNTGDSNRIFIYSNGNIVNVNNSYGALSDIKLKENIVDATPKLDNLMKVKVRNYNLIGDDKKQIGVIAQELEEIFPAMIDESPDRDKNENDLGTTTKSVKYSVFVPMLIKSIQEQQTQIESLKSRIEILEQ